MAKVYHVTQLSLFTSSKLCSSCHKEKPLEDFSLNPKMLSGRQSACKQCHSERERKRRAIRNQNKPPKIKVCAKCGKELDKTIKKSYCEPCQKEYSHAHYMANHEKRNAQIKAYREAHKDWYKAYAHEYNQRPENKARKNALSRKYNRTERRRAYNRAYQHRTRTGNPQWQERERNRYHTRRKEQSRAAMRRRNATPEFKAYRKAYNAAHPEQAIAHNAKRRIKYATNPQYVQKQRADGKAWRKAHPLKAAEQSRRRHARQRGTTVGRVSYSAILRRDGYWCYICEQMILPEQKIQFDHVIPLSRTGGTHTMKNIKPTHACCNTRKNARLLEEMTPFDRRGPDA